MVEIGIFTLLCWRDVLVCIEVDNRYFVLLGIDGWMLIDVAWC